MKKSQFTEPQIAFALQQAEAGTTAGEVCRKMGTRAESQPSHPRRSCIATARS